jgi:outer membrane protein TolC
MELPTPNREASIQEALTQRPEVTATLQKIRAAQVRTEVAVHELKPTLNLVLQAYAHGLDGGFNVGQAWVNQFGTGAPGYTAGAFFEAPLGNAAAQARLRRREMEARQLTLEFNATLKSVSADVDNVIRDIDAARATAIGQQRAMVAAQAELDYIISRWRMLPGEDRATSLMLDEALDALDRLVNAEGALAQAQVDYALTLIQYKRATGRLFQIQTVRPAAGEEMLVSRRATEPLPRPATVQSSFPRTSLISTPSQQQRR